MSFLSKLFSRRKDRADPIPTGRRTAAGINRWGPLSPYRSRSMDILKTLRSIPEESQAIDFLKRVSPDLSMAVWNFVRLANQGHQIAFYDINNPKDRLTDVEKKWNEEFAPRVYSLSNSGLDGLIDLLHQTALTKGAMMVEVDVLEDRTDIYDVYVIDPMTIEWEWEERDGRKVLIPYQQQDFKKVSLEHANFFWNSIDCGIDDPRGTLSLTPALQSIDFQMQILTDLQAVLHHQGFPRQDFSLNRESAMDSAPSECRANPKKMGEYLQARWNEVVGYLRALSPDDDYVHWDDVTINTNQGANANRSLDVRAIDELVSVQVLNGLKQMGILTNRVGGIGETESWGSLTFLIFCQGITNIQRGSKRLIESVARLWCRVHGIQARPVFTHNVVNWENEEQRYKVKLMKQEFYAIAKYLGWIDNDTAAQEVMGVEKAISDMPPEAIRVSFERGESPDADEHAPGRFYDKLLYLQRKDEAAQK